MKLIEDEEIVFLDAKEVAAMFGCSVLQARSIMHRRDFPAVKVGKGLKVMKKALIEWASERRT